MVGRVYWLAGVRVSSVCPNDAGASAVVLASDAGGFESDGGADGLIHLQVTNSKQDKDKNYRILHFTHRPPLHSY
jgi:hypothetical protein